MIAQKVGDAAEWLCSHTGERLAWLLHPVITWGWTTVRRDGYLDD